MSVSIDKSGSSRLLNVWICRGEVFGKRELAPNFTQSKESGRGNNGGNNGGGKNFKRKKNNR